MTSESKEKYDRDITIAERINQFDRTKATLTTGGSCKLHHKNLFIQDDNINIKQR